MNASAPARDRFEPPLLRVIRPEDVTPPVNRAVDPETVAMARMIVGDVRERGMAAVEEHAVRLGDCAPGDPLLLGPGDLRRALEGLDREARGVLERAADRIAQFAHAQRACLRDLVLPIPGGTMGHRAVPVQRAGCYAPGGRFPLPSSVLMTAVTARAAGVEEVWVASPKPAPATLAAAALAGATGLLAAGGAQAIAALAVGAGAMGPCDAIVGPGNRWVTAAKQLFAGTVAIDSLAGPTELVVVADDSADAGIVAADLIAQAEHDADASAVLLALDETLPGRVEQALRDRLRTLPTAQTAASGLRNGFAVSCSSRAQAVDLVDRLAPEHLEIMTRDAGDLASRVRHCGAMFIGAGAAEVLGDYGAGPNHVLPTGGTARSFAGLSVLTFLRVRTFIRVDGRTDAGLYRDAAALARIEGLEGHARAAEERLG